MPLYEYECLSCGKRTEWLQRFDDAPLAACPACGGEVKKLVSSPAFQFKGSGWYVTDYAGKKGGSDGKSEAKSEGKAEGASEGKSEGKSESKAGDGEKSSSSEPAKSSASESKPAAASSSSGKAD